MDTQGLFITFEGQECAGKTTQVQLLTRWLEERGYTVLCTREPGGTVLAEEIRRLLLNSGREVGICPEAELLLFCASRAQHVQQVILPALRQGKVVICDRFCDSTAAYQGYARGLDLRHIRNLRDFCTSGVMPQLTFLLDLTVGESRRRLALRSPDGADRMESENDGFFEKVRQGFLAIAAEEPERVKCLNAASSVEEIQTAIRREVSRVLA